MELTTKIDRPYYLAGDATHLFVSSNNESGVTGLWRVDKASGEALPLVNGGGAGVAVDGTHAYLCDRTNHRLVRAAKDGVGALQELRAEDCDECAVADGTLYCSNFFSHHVFRITTEGQGYQLLYAENGAKPEGIKVDATRLYLALHGKRQIVAALRNAVPPFVGADLATLDAVGASLPRRIALDDSYVYWVGYAGADVRRAAKDGSGATTIANGPAIIGVGGIAVDATYAYWVTATDRGGRVLRVKKGGGGVPEVLAEDLETPVDVLVDDRAIYITVNGLSLDAGAPPGVAPIGKVLRVAKPP